MTRFDVIGSIELAGPTGLTSAMVVGFRRTEAQLVLPSSPGREGDAVELYFPELEEISVDAQDSLVRESVPAHIAGLEPQAEGVKLKVAIARELPVRSQRVLDEALRLLLGRAEQGSGKRKHPRIEGHLQLRCESDHPNAALRDLSFGGLGMFTPEPLAIGRKVRVALLDREGEELLTIRAHVRHQRTALHEGQPGFLVGLEFVPLTPERRCIVEALLRHLAGA